MAKRRIAGEQDGAPIEGFRGPIVCKTVGITYRQLDYWARTELVQPSIKPAEGSGSQRLYSFADVVHLKVIKKLLDAGVSLQQVRKAVEFLRNELQEPMTDVMLVSDGVSVYARTKDELIDLLAGGQAVFGIAVGKVYEELQGTLQGTIAQLKPERQPGAQEGADASSG
jgi:DNA-binding transcriptional MerR regulator